MWGESPCLRAVGVCRGPAATCRQQLLGLGISKQADTRLAMLMAQVIIMVRLATRPPPITSYIFLPRYCALCFRLAMLQGRQSIQSLVIVQQKAEADENLLQELCHLLLQYLLSSGDKSSLACLPMRATCDPSTSWPSRQASNPPTGFKLAERAVNQPERLKFS